MSIKLDWEVSDAPEDPGQPKRSGATPPAARAPLASNPVITALPAQPTSRRRLWLWSWTLLVLVALTGIGLTATWYISRQGWQRIAGDVEALVRYEEEAAYAGNVNLALSVQDPDNNDWLMVRRDDFEAGRPAPPPLPWFTLPTHAYAIDSLTALDGDFVLAEVRRQFVSPEGRSLAFVLPQFYRRRGLDDWQHTAPPGQFWGTWLDWHGQFLEVRHSERDTEFVKAVAPRLETWLLRACQLWGDRCGPLLPARLYLSGYVGSLEYDPLSNVEVRVEFGDGRGGLEADYFLSIPSPQIAGQPVDDAGQDYLAEYLAVRLIASLANRAASSLDESLSLTAWAIDALALQRGDPGYAGLTNIVNVTTPQGQATPAPSRTPLPTYTTRPNVPLVVTYTVQEGDTLSAIAESYGVTVDLLIRANNLPDADFIGAGLVLMIPLPQ